MKKKAPDFLSPLLSVIVAAAGRFTRHIEQFSHRYLLAPNRWLLSRIDPLSYALEGTIVKKILQVTIFPLFMVLTLVVGFKLVENGYHHKFNFFSTVLTLIILGIIFAPLERLLPFSRKWLDDKDEPIDVMVFFHLRALPHCSPSAGHCRTGDSRTVSRYRT